MGGQFFHPFLPKNRMNLKIKLNSIIPPKFTMCAKKLQENTIFREYSRIYLIFSIKRTDYSKINRWGT